MLYVVADRYPPYRADVEELFARQLSARDIEIDWLMQRGPNATAVSSPALFHGCRTFLTHGRPGGGIINKLLDNVLAFLGDLSILPLAFKGRYDVIQVRDKFFAGIVAWAAARLTGARFYHWMSYPYPESRMYLAKHGLVENRRFVWLKGRVSHALLYRIILPLADHVFVQSERMREDVAQQGIASEKMTPVPMGIRSEQVGSADDARAPDTQNPTILYLGVIFRLRRTEMLVRVLHEVRRTYANARLVLVGEGQRPADRSIVEEEAARLGLEEAVEITGFLPMEEAWQHVRRADICISPFYPVPVLLSTSPTKLIEYLAMAKCVVANEHPEQTQILAESGVGRTIPWDEQEFAKEICRQLENPESARQAAARGPDWVRQHRTYDIIAEQLAERYRSLHDRAGRADSESGVDSNA